MKVVPFKILPGTGRWRAEGVTEGAPFTTSLRVGVPLPVVGRN